jgi:hypothetical protein
VDGPWEFDPSNMEPSKDDPNTVALIGVREGGANELERLGTPPKIGGSFRKHLAQRGLCGSLMMSN